MKLILQKCVAKRINKRAAEEIRQGMLSKSVTWFWGVWVYMFWNPFLKRGTTFATSWILLQCTIWAASRVNGPSDICNVPKFRCTCPSVQPDHSLWLNTVLHATREDSDLTVDEQADLSHHRLYMSEGLFFAKRLIYLVFILWKISPPVFLTKKKSNLNIKKSSSFQ